MLRFIRVLGIIISAVLLAWSAYSVRNVFSSGEAYEKYNTAGRSRSALLVFSLIAFGGLSFLEISNIKKKSEKIRYGQTRRTRNEDETDGLDSSNIYSAPKSVDDWQSKQRRTMPRRHGNHVDFPKIWMSILSMLSLFLPVIYLGTLMWLWTSAEEVTTVTWFIRGYLMFVGLFSVIAAIGIITSRIWGQACGYCLATLNLLMFPYGIALGLILLVCLMGANPSFVTAAEQRKKRRKHRARRMRARAV